MGVEDAGLFSPTALEALINESRAWSEKLAHAQKRLSEPLPPMPRLGRDVVFTRAPATLYRYHPTRALRRASTPILIVFALVNRPDILDLTPDTSLIQKLLDSGREVYLLDWGYPSRATAHWGLEHYVGELMTQAFEVFQGRPIDLLGVCQGGTLALLHAALYPEHIRKLIVMISTVDFHTDDNLLTQWARHIDFNAFVERFPLVPQAFLNHSFEMLRPFKQNLDKLEYLIKHANDPEQLLRYRLIERWRTHGPDHAGKAFCEYMTWFYQNNALFNGAVVLKGQRLDFAALKRPVLGIYAAFDHIVPLQGARALSRLLPQCAVQEAVVSTGHIGVYVSQKAGSVAALIDGFSGPGAKE